MGLLCTIMKFVIGLILAFGILLLTLGLIYTPRHLKFHVTGAELTRFDYVDNQLHYKLALNITVRNPNKRYRVYYDTNEMVVLYKTNRLQTRWLPAFFQDTKNTAVLGPSNFEGQQLVGLGGDELLEFDAEKATGVYHVDVRFFLRMRLKSGGLVLKYKPKVYCGLKVPLSAFGENAFAFFQNSDCDFKF